MYAQDIANNISANYYVLYLHSNIVIKGICIHSLVTSFGIPPPTKKIMEKERKTTPLST